MASFYVNIDVEALFCRCSTRFNFHCVHSRGRIWNPPLRTANSVAFCLPPTSAGWGHPALRPTEKGERRAASPLAAVPVYGSEKLCVLPLPTKSTVKGECRKPAGRACPAPTARLTFSLQTPLHASQTPGRRGRVLSATGTPDQSCAWRQAPAAKPGTPRWPRPP